jgi:hypothetical protein
MGPDRDHPRSLANRPHDGDRDGEPGNSDAINEDTT